MNKEDETKALIYNATIDAWAKGFEMGQQIAEQIYN